MLNGSRDVPGSPCNRNLPRLNDECKLPYIADLVAAKAGGKEKGTLDAADLAFHRAEYERLMTRLQDEQRKSTLPEHNSALDGLSNLLVKLRFT